MIPATQDLQLNIVRYTAEQKTVWDSFCLLYTSDAADEL